MLIMFRIERSALRRTSSSSTISGASRSRHWQMFSSVTIFMYLQLLQPHVSSSGGAGINVLPGSASSSRRGCRFGDDDELIGPAAAAIVEDRSRRPHEISHLDDIGPAFGMHDDAGCGVLLFEPEQFSSENSSWTWHAPSQITIFSRPVSFLM